MQGKTIAHSVPPAFHILEAFSCWRIGLNLPPLPSGVLGSILKVQQLDIHDIEGVSVLYHRLRHRNNAANGMCLPSNYGEATTEGLDASEADHARAIAQLLALTNEDALKIIRDYLIAATAKDCSIMIACRQCPDMNILRHETQSYYECQVRVADFDLKATSKIESHMRLDAEILASHRAGLASGSMQ